MTEADLRAMFEAWIKGPTAHRTANLIGAIVRYAMEHATKTYPPQIAPTTYLDARAQNDFGRGP